MSDTKFTRGPWEVGSHEIIDGAMDYINIKGPDGYHVSKVSSREEYDANANLIAAAPDLYEALQFLMKAYADAMLDCKGIDVGRCGDVAYDVAGVSLDKARGES